MDTNSILDFIDKVIEKTKSGSLDWKTFSPAHVLRPLIDVGNPIATDLISTDDLLLLHSYYAPYKTGELVLLVYQTEYQQGYSSPPENCTISLRMQDDKSKHAFEITCTLYDPVDAKALIRLYNIVDNANSFSVDALVKDFLNS